MKKIWDTIIEEALNHKKFFHVSGKRINQNVSHTFPLKDFWKEDMTLEMLGYSKKKLKMLTDYYFNQESVEVAKRQLENRRKKGTYGSVGVTTYNHFAKKERPMHGPCIQALVFTHLPTRVVNVDVYYRTTEVFKKFGADLVWLHQVLLPNFMPDGTITFHFTGQTYHPMYWVVSAPYLSDPVETLKCIKQSDPVAWKGIIRWTERYVKQPDNLLKFKQAHRVSKHMHALVPKPQMKALAKYVAVNYKLVSNTVIIEGEDEE